MKVEGPYGEAWLRRDHLSVPKTHPGAEGEICLGRLGIQAKHDAMGDGEGGLIKRRSLPTG